jgi:hypothetical protein
MPQHDYDIANQSGAAFRADLNNALSAVATVNSGNTAPSPTFANQLWADTSTNKLRQRNTANTAWVEVGDLNSANLGLLTASTAASTYVALTGNQTIAGTKTFSTTPVVGTATTGTNSTAAASTAYVVNRVAQDAPTKTGGGASGTWGIDISGQSATVADSAITPAKLSSGGPSWDTNGVLTAFSLRSSSSGQTGALQASFNGAVGVGSITNHTFTLLQASTERARFESVYFRIGTSINYASLTRMQLRCIGGGAEFGIGIEADTLVTGTSWIEFTSNGGIGRGNIAWGGSGLVFQSFSDYRLKENVAPINGAVERLKRLRPIRYNMIEFPDQTIDGFLAHEVKEVIPEAVTGEKDEVDKNGKPKYQGLDQGRIVPLLTAALQEALAKIDELEARLNAASL